MNTKLIVLCLIILLSIICWTNNRETYANYYLGQPTKCFDCERQLPDNKKYLGGPSKCFDCEAQIAQRRGPEHADLAQPSKCFDCEHY